MELNKFRLLKCGHYPNATDKDKKPCCVICNCNEFVPEQPNLKGRMAKCCDCGRLTPSDSNLAFMLSYRPNEKYDSYYCGCKGWD